MQRLSQICVSAVRNAASRRSFLGTLLSIWPLRLLAAPERSEVMADQPNPLVERALRECIEQVRGGAVFKFADDATLTMLADMCRSDFVKLLSPANGAQVWEKDGPNVRKMAWWVGTSSRFVAEAYGRDTIQKDDALAGFKFVHDTCQARRATEREYCASAYRAGKP